VVDATKGIQA
jgi:translation elongation factor EF-4